MTRSSSAAAMLACPPPTEYTSFVYAAVLGFLVFGERVSAFTVAGATIIVVACLYAAQRRDIAETPIEMNA